MKRVILGSSSAGRKAILTQMLGHSFEVIAPSIDEKAIRDNDPSQLTLKLSRAKVDAVLSKVEGEAIIICSDQVIVCNGQIREKPLTKVQCEEYLLSYSKYPAEAVDAVVVVNTKTGKRAEGVARAKQYFKEIPQHKISEFIEQGDIMFCAGGFAIERMQEYLGEREGEESTVIGLPKTLTFKLLAEVEY
eukprot:TRINITY_DN2512_c0_g1_i2.p1 TRINITY_DN2512_c0_g1~~TRINITY_DN2512_c0_g1_i2.p1  ORF type:complete len:190 (-),score=26.87 TRINITY_DN2512_c0_g1_i2:34-603(-)